MTTLRYIPHLRKLGFSVRLKPNGKIGIRPSMPPDLKAKVEKKEPELRAELESMPVIPCPHCRNQIRINREDNSGWGWYECSACDNTGTWYGSRPYMVIDSGLLGERIAIGHDWPEHRIGYTFAEVARLAGLAPEHIKLIHAVKKHFGGEVCE